MDGPDMALDPSIIMNLGRGVTPLKSPAEIQDEQMQREVNSLKLGQLRQGLQDDQAQRDIARNTDPESLAGAYYKAGLVKPAQEAIKFQSEQQKSKREAMKAQVEQNLLMFEKSAQIMNGVKDQASWDRARQQTAEIFGPEAAQQMPAQYDPALIEQKRAQALTVKQQLEEKWKAMEYSTPSANAQLQAQTSSANNAATIANSRQTAQMTDARAREFNATKVEENNLKREQKQDTADMTKAGQVASFDTMLGTLDRLSQHPGLQRSVGLLGKLPTMPGGDSANFQAELDTFQSQAFVPMVAQLKGMGALSDAEGRKLTQAVGALNPNMGEKAFRDSIKRITTDMNAARARVVGNKGAAVTPPSGGLDASGIEAELRKRGLLK
jgi:hypothetical protein